MWPNMSKMNCTFSAWANDDDDYDGDNNKQYEDACIFLFVWASCWLCILKCCPNGHWSMPKETVTFHFTKTVEGLQQVMYFRSESQSYTSHISQRNFRITNTHTCFIHSFSLCSMTWAYVLPIIAINMFNSRIGTRIIKIVKTVFANVGYEVRLNSEYWKKEKKKHVTQDT